VRSPETKSFVRKTATQRHLQKTKCQTQHGKVLREKEAAPLCKFARFMGRMLHILWEVRPLSGSKTMLCKSSPAATQLLKWLCSVSIRYFRIAHARRTFPPMKRANLHPSAQGSPIFWPKGESLCEGSNTTALHRLRQNAANACRVASRARS